MTDHISDEDAAGLAMLDPRDDERVRSEAHGAECDVCREKLESARATLNALAVLDEPPAPDRTRMALIRAAVEARTTPRRSPLAWLAAFAVALASVALAVFDIGPSGVAFGPKCLVIELGVAVVPAAVALLLVRRRIVGSAAVTAAAMAGAFGGQCFLHFTCPAHDAPHLLLYHVGGVAAAGLLALLAGFRFGRFVPG